MHRVNIVGRHVEISQATKVRATEKLEKLQRYFDGIQGVELILSEEGDHKQAEIIASVAHASPIVVKEENSEVFAAIDMAIDRIENLLKRHKEKNRDKRKGSSAGRDAPDFGSVGIADESEMNDDD